MNKQKQVQSQCKGLKFPVVNQEQYQFFFHKQWDIQKIFKKLDTNSPSIKCTGAKHLPIASALMSALMYYILRIYKSSKNGEKAFQWDRSYLNGVILNRNLQI